MKHIHFDVESDGFYGAYWACKDRSDCTVIAMLGDDPEDYMARSAVKWLIRLGVNVLTMSPGKKDYGHHNYGLDLGDVIGVGKGGDQRLHNAEGQNDNRQERLCRQSAMHIKNAAHR